MSNVLYELKDGAPISGNAQAIGEELKRIENEHGKAEPEVVVAVAEDPDNPLHDYFTWDDAEAARKQRLSEARRLTRSVVVKEVDGNEPDNPTRAFVHVSDDDGKGYQSTTVAMRDQDKREQILERARRDLKRFRERYGHLEEFAELIDLIDNKVPA